MKSANLCQTPLNPSLLHAGFYCIWIFSLNVMAFEMKYFTTSPLLYPYYCYTSYNSGQMTCIDLAVLSLFCLACLDRWCGLVLFLFAICLNTARKAHYYSVLALLLFKSLLSLNVSKITFWKRSIHWLMQVFFVTFHSYCISLCYLSVIVI